MRESLLPRAFDSLLPTVNDALASGGARLEIGQPRLLTAGTMLALYGFGLLRVIPVLVAIVVVSLVPFGAWSVVVPLLAIVVTTASLPFTFGNTLITKLVHRLAPAAAGGEDAFVVQLTFSPRLRSGLRALVEDADDIGCLRFTPSELVFDGDSVKLSVPGGQIGRVESRNIGLRGLFLYGARIEVTVSGLSNVRTLEFTERSSKTCQSKVMSYRQNGLVKGAYLWQEAGRGILWRAEREAWATDRNWAGEAGEWHGPRSQLRAKRFAGGARGYCWRWPRVRMSPVLHRPFQSGSERRRGSREQARTRASFGSGVRRLRRWCNCRQRGPGPGRLLRSGTL